MCTLNWWRYPCGHLVYYYASCTAGVVPPFTFEQMRQCFELFRARKQANILNSCEQQDKLCPHAMCDSIARGVRCQRIIGQDSGRDIYCDQVVEHNFLPNGKYFGGHIALATDGTPVFHTLGDDKRWIQLHAEITLCKVVSRPFPNPNPFLEGMERTGWTSDQQQNINKYHSESKHGLTPSNHARQSPSTSAQTYGASTQSAYGSSAQRNVGQGAPTQSGLGPAQRPAGPSTPAYGYQPPANYRRTQKPPLLPPKAEPRGPRGL
ncbi:hypothetical protein C8R47DRAFT_1070583 [Mycena vitilis]|nr:hypothetical protein C8R47DRAFT_1070583 [Mycena vitilis]